MTRFPIIFGLQGVGVVAGRGWWISENERGGAGAPPSRNVGVLRALRGLRPQTVGYVGECDQDWVDLPA